jgi:hypothetical protein
MQVLSLGDNREMTRYLAENGMCFLRGFAEFVHYNVIRLEVEMIKLMIENVVVVWWHVWLLTLFWQPKTLTR